jgi:phosphate starvation-inducible membrane PsiE
MKNELVRRSELTVMDFGTFCFWVRIFALNLQLGAGVVASMLPQSSNAVFWFNLTYAIMCGFTMLTVLLAKYAPSPRMKEESDMILFAYTILAFVASHITPPAECTNYVQRYYYVATSIIQFIFWFSLGASIVSVFLKRWYPEYMAKVERSTESTPVPAPALKVRVPASEE